MAAARRRISIGELRGERRPGEVHEHGRQGGALDLPVLRRRLWPEVYVKDEKVVQIEGDPESPISRGRLCPKGSASEKLVNSPMRDTRVRYRRPGATEWEDLSLERATDTIAERIIRTRSRRGRRRPRTASR